MQYSKVRVGWAGSVVNQCLGSCKVHCSKLPVGRPDRPAIKSLKCEFLLDALSHTFSSSVLQLDGHEYSPGH